MLAIPVDLLRRSSRAGCSWCSILEAALDLPGLNHPAGDALFGVALFAGGASENRYSEEMSLPLIMRLQTEFLHYAEVENFTERGINWGVVRVDSS
jgi:hypothetical protein